MGEDVDGVQPVLKPSPPNGEKRLKTSWGFEALAWIPFGLLPLLASRTTTDGLKAELTAAGEVESEQIRSMSSSLEQKTELAAAEVQHSPGNRGGPDPVVAMIAVRGQRWRSARPRQTLPEWICM